MKSRRSNKQKQSTRREEAFLHRYTRFSVIGPYHRNHARNSAPCRSAVLTWWKESMDFSKPRKRIYPRRRCQALKEPRRPNRVQQGMTLSGSEAHERTRVSTCAHSTQDGWYRPEEDTSVSPQTPRLNVRSVQLCPLIIVDATPSGNLP